MSMHTEARCLANPTAQKKLARALNASTRAAGRYKQMDDHHRENKRSIRNRGALIPSVIYLACRYKGVAHTLIQEGDKTDVYKAFMRCKEVLGNEQEWDTLHSMPRTHEERNTFFREGGNEISFCHISLF